MMMNKYILTLLIMACNVSVMGMQAPALSNKSNPHLMVKALATLSEANPEKFLLYAPVYNVYSQRDEFVYFPTLFQGTNTANYNRNYEFRVDLLGYRNGIANIRYQVKRRHPWSDSSLMYSRDIIMRNKEVHHCLIPETNLLVTVHAFINECKTNNTLKELS